MVNGEWRMSGGEVACCLQHRLFSSVLVSSRHVACSENKLTAKAAKSAKKNKTSLRALCVLRGKIFMFIGVPVHVTCTEKALSLTLLAANSGNPELPVIAKPAAFAGVPMPPTTVDREAFIDWQVKTWQALAGPDYPTEKAILLAAAQRNFDRGFDPDGLTRQQTVSLVGHLESASYRLNNLATITAPTVVLQGTADPLVPMAAAEEIVARVPGAELRLIPGFGHDIPLELVTTFADAITAAAERASA